MRRDPKRKNSNPVWYLNLLIKEGFERHGYLSPGRFIRDCRKRIDSMMEDSITLPRNLGINGAIDISGINLGKKKAGSIGLLVDSKGIGFVTELRVRRHVQWDVAANLPFHEEHIVDALMQLLRECNADSVLPQLQPYFISDSLGERADGGSMDISCLMAIVESEAGNRQDNLLDFVCSVVQPGSNGKLVPVGGTKAKLSAFKREYNRGSLLIHHPETNLDEVGAADCFSTYWEVDSYGALAEKLEVAGLIKPLLKRQSLTMESVEAVRRQIRFYENEGEDRLKEAEELARTAICCINDGTPSLARIALTKLEEDMQRHQGDFENAIGNAERYLFDDRFEKTASYEDLVSRDYRLSASYYDAHRFDEIKERLGQWVEKTEQDPRIVLVETRPKLLNTYGRVLSALDEDGWENSFWESLRIQSEILSLNVDRTRNYLIKAYLQKHEIDQAQEQIQIAESRRDSMDRNSRDHLDFYQADLHRQMEKHWEPEWLDFSVPIVAHARAFCLQAFARQHDCCQEAAGLLNVAADSLAEKNCDTSNIKVFLGRACRLGAAVHGGDPEDIAFALGQVKNYLAKEAASAMRKYYEIELAKLETKPSLENLNGFFDRIPHF